jgi:hypothetical protein
MYIRSHKAAPTIPRSGDTALCGNDTRSKALRRRAAQNNHQVVLIISQYMAIVNIPVTIRSSFASTNAITCEKKSFRTAYVKPSEMTSYFSWKRRACAKPRSRAPMPQHRNQSMLRSPICGGNRTCGQRRSAARPRHAPPAMSVYYFTSLEYSEETHRHLPLYFTP